MLTVAEAAARLQVTPERVRNMIYDGILPAERLGRNWMIAERDVLERLCRQPKAGRPRKDVEGDGIPQHLSSPQSFDIGEARELYHRCKSELYGCYDLGFLDQAHSEEERRFYITVADFFLQQRQAELIKRGAY
jgi:excisionase family DNA binding protein